ncbi:MAG: hypothetical protein BMS9Abin36_0707 [Gammaproteobacteria bacterium]|nr:MAG: hypothetical protein BMS9Abin36_0707 [Gammaproteobacteria bacterium]
MKSIYIRAAMLTGLSVLLSGPVMAGITVFKDGESYVKVGGRIQIQYHRQDPDTGSAGDKVTDEVFFRRFRPYIEGSKHKDWKGKLQWDMGKSKLAVKDAYIQYTGLPGHVLTIGNAGFPFSREYMTSSKKSQLVERSFVGDHNYGTPNKNLGVQIKGRVLGKRLFYAAGLASASIDPDQSKLDFDTPVNKKSDFNEGWMVGGHVEFHPMGTVKFQQGDFSHAPRFMVGVGVYSWSNDDDNNTQTDAITGLDKGNNKPDVDLAIGTELSAGFRGWGASADVQYNRFTAELVDGAYTGGMYENGEARFSNLAVEGGYMIMPRVLEIVAGVQAQDADAYNEVWTRNSLGMNYFFYKHDIKIQSAYRKGRNLDGVKNKNKDELFV